MEKPHQVTPEEFLKLTADKKPTEAFCQTVIGSFDWQTWTIFFYDGDTKIQTSFEGSAHATPDIPQALMDMVERAEINDDPRALRRIVQP